MSHTAAQVREMVAGAPIEAPMYLCILTFWPRRPPRRAMCGKLWHI
jgi:hypothetical protein